MVLDSITSPHRRNNQNSIFLTQSKTKGLGRDDASDWSTLLERHRFLLTMLVLLAFLCTVYLYFAVTLGTSSTCAGLSGAQRAICEAKSNLLKGKLKFL